MNRSSQLPNERLKTLVNSLLNEQFDEAEALELRVLLTSSAEHRSYYRKQVELHSQLSWLLKSSSEEIESNPTQLQKETDSLFGPKPTRRLAPILMPIAALFVVGLIIALLQRSPSDPIVKTASAPETTNTVLSHASKLKWHSDSPIARQGAELEAQIYHLKEGFLHLDVGTGSKVFIEAPCRFEPVHNMLLKVHEGRVNAEVSEAGHGFTLWTPAGKFVDLGTRFGISVGSDESGNDVILSEVFTGEVKVEPRDRKPTANKTITEGDTLGLLGRLSYVEISKTVDERPIKLDFNRYEETTAIDLYRAQDVHNLALGKKARSSTHYVGANGEIFPAENLTDGRINDTGFPGNWSFWLASNEKPVGEIIIDLGDQQVIDCLQLLNTHNRHHRDRGTKEFTLSTSSDSKNYQKAVSGRLRKLDEKLTADGPPVIETFVFPERPARYLKLVIHTFYRGPKPTTSAGLNEIRIFGPSMPLEMRKQILQSAKPNLKTTP